jgi:hypothetical protein
MAMALRLLLLLYIVLNLISLAVLGWSPEKI